ncbi:nucleotide exchange factor GrpE [Patescibacteria group bacterium]|nr:nucleotide exchange factor GrpE [Patescibacteria group bacterium]
MEQKDIEKLQKKIKELQKEKEEFLAGWQRAKADLVNYKKEERQRLQGLMEYVRGEFLASLLPTVDNLERAEKELKDEERNSKLVQGFLQIAKQLKDFLYSQGVKEIEAEGKNFNPALHEAVGMVQGEKPGKVVEVVEKGYTIKDILLRPAKVKVVR